MQTWPRPEAEHFDNSLGTSLGRPRVKAARGVAWNSAQKKKKARTVYFGGVGSGLSDLKQG